jgi:hypothetical protein
VVESAATGIVEKANSNAMVIMKFILQKMVEFVDLFRFDDWLQSQIVREVQSHGIEKARLVPR